MLNAQVNFHYIVCYAKYESRDFQTFFLARNKSVYLKWNICVQSVLPHSKRLNLWNHLIKFSIANIFFHRQKFQVWAWNMWNPCDAFAIIFFLVGLSLRLQPAYMDVGRVIYCVDSIYWYLRILNILGVNKYLGKKKKNISFLNTTNYIPKTKCNRL